MASRTNGEAPRGSPWVGAHGRFGRPVGLADHLWAPLRLCFLCVVVMWVLRSVLWHPRFLTSVINSKGRISRVRPRSTWVITLKTPPNKPYKPLDQVNTPLWSTFGQRHGQTPLKHWRRQMSSGTFAAFSKFHLNISKSTNMKVVQFVEEHNFPVDWHFKFWLEIGEKLGQLPASPVHRDRATFKVWLHFMQNPLRKTP
jgi:hypothetical protein